MKNQEKMKKLSTQIDKVFEKIKRKALKAAPAFAMALPGGATIATYLIAYNQHIAAQQAALNAAQIAEKFAVTEKFANAAFDYVRAIAIGDETEIERTLNIAKNIFYITEDEEYSLAQKYLGMEGDNFIFEQVATSDKYALDQTAQMLGMKDGTELSLAMANDPILEQSARAVYMDNLYDQINAVSDNLLATNYMIELGTEYSDALAQAAENANQANFASGLGIALTAATMAVGGVLLYKQQKKVQKLEQEVAAMDNKKSEQEMEM